MSGKAVLDSNTIMDLFNGRIPLESFKQAPADREHLLSVITEIARLSFPRISNEQKTPITVWLAKREIIPLTEEIKHKAIAFRRSTNQKLPDSIITASSIVSNAVPYHG